MEGLKALAEGIGAQADEALETESVGGVLTITAVLAAMQANQAWMKEIQKISYQYYVDSLSKDKDAPIKTAKDAQEKTIATQKADVETGKLNTLVEMIKSGVERTVQDLDGIIEVEDPLNALENLSTSLIGRG